MSKAKTVGRGSSMVRRISVRMFFRLLWIFISLNIMICLITGISLVIYCENQLEHAAYQVSAGETPKAGVIRSETEYNGGFSLGNPFSALLPEYTRNLNREIDIFGAGNSLGLGLGYSIYFPEGEGKFTKLTIDLSDFIIIFSVSFASLWVWELITLVVKSIKNYNLIYKSLNPIWDLTRAAETLGRAADKREPDMSAFKGALDSIDVTRLDTRIEIDTTQHELQGLAAAINEMLDRIRAAYIAQIRFVSDASHELRTPISVIQGYANLLDRWGKKDEKTLQEGIDAIRSEADSMKSLVEQLLFLARGDNNTITLDPELFDLKDLCDEIVQDTKLIDTEHELRLEASKAPVFADRQLIKQAARILVDNAIKYTDSGGYITIRSSVEGDEAVLSVTDTGIGIPEEMLPNIFDRFVRADESRTRSSGGAGLGLSIARWIVGRHSGHMDALSRTGLGTRISIMLPLAKDEPAAENEISKQQD